MATSLYSSMRFRTMPSLLQSMGPSTLYSSQSMGWPQYQPQPLPCRHATLRSLQSLAPAAVSYARLVLPVVMEVNRPALNATARTS